ncbi:MAG: cohesin domain-containing protein [Patescibacteria group bacterium]|nr:cohesin domain-containing protein [Patescibacteria group bacterium]
MKNITFFIFLLSIFIPFSSFGATIYFSPSEGEFEIKKNFKLVVYIDSDQEINAVGGKISFDNNFLNVVNISDSGSIINFWAIKPNFDNKKGEIVFEGVSLNKSFKGKNGRLIEINFKGIKEINKTVVKFDNVQILANDGEGTNVFEKNINGMYKIYKKIVNITQSLSSSMINETKITLPKPVIISKTHPDQNRWYNKNNVELEWELDKNIKKVRMILTQYFDKQPSIVYEPAINYKKIDNLNDGRYYFKLQFEDENSKSEVEIYKINIDTTPPKLELKEKPRKFIYEYPFYSILAEDNLSDIDYFEIYLNNQFITTTRENLVNLEKFNIKPGKYLLGVKVFDRAGNYNYQTVNFEIGEREILTEKKLKETKKIILEVNVYLLLLIFLIILFIFILILIYFKNRRLHHKLKEEIRKIEEFSHKSFIALKKDLEKQLEILESKNQEELIKEERELIQHLRKHINYINLVIEKNLQDIDKIIK